MRWMLILIAMVAAAGPASAERVIVGLSAKNFGISSNFTGGEITVFGTIQRDAGTVARRGRYDIAVVVNGPRRNIVTRKKERVAGIWVNRRAETFPGAPSYYAMLSSAPLEDIAAPALLTKKGVGSGYLRLQPQDSDEAFSDTVFREALIRLKKQDNLYYDLTDAVMFLAPSLFSATIPLPENVVVGDYSGDVYLFGDGVLLGEAEFSFTIQKEGFEQFMYGLAHEWSFIYGICAVLVAFITGWAAGVIFRKD